MHHDYPLELLAWGQAAKWRARENADSITPDVPRMPGMDGDAYSSARGRERQGWLSLEQRLGASVAAALDDDWRPLIWMRRELCDTL